MADSTINSSIDACAPTGEAPGLGGERVVWTFFQSILSASAWKVTVLRTFEVRSLCPAPFLICKSRSESKSMRIKTLLKLRIRILSNSFHLKASQISNIYH